MTGSGLPAAAMAEQSRLLRVTSLRGLVPARVTAVSVIEGYGKWISLIRTQCGAEVASLFAQPAPPPAADPNNPSMAWHTQLEGPIEEVARLDPTSRAV